MIGIGFYFFFLVVLTCRLVPVQALPAGPLPFARMQEKGTTPVGSSRHRRGVGWAGTLRGATATIRKSGSYETQHWLGGTSLLLAVARPFPGVYLHQDGEPCPVLLSVCQHASCRHMQAGYSYALPSTSMLPICVTDVRTPVSGPAQDAVPTAAALSSLVSGIYYVRPN